jgi:hypothetical protein
LLEVQKVRRRRLRRKSLEVSWPDQLVWKFGEVGLEEWLNLGALLRHDAFDGHDDIVGSHLRDDPAAFSGRTKITSTSPGFMGTLSHVPHSMIQARFVKLTSNLLGSPLPLLPMLDRVRVPVQVVDASPRIGNSVGCMALANLVGSIFGDTPSIVWT